MIPQITTWDELLFAIEDGDPISTSFGLLGDNDAFYHGRLDGPKAEISIEQLRGAFLHIPDDTIYPEWCLLETDLRKAPEPLPTNIYIKRPTLELYSTLKNMGIEKQLSSAIIAEAQVLEELQQHPHPHMIRYHGCRVVRGHITGLVLERHPHDLQAHIENGKMVDNTLFMAALESVIRHLHGLGWAHNDLHPSNVLVSETGMPILIDFEGCQKFGTPLKHIRGTKEWIEGEIADHNISEARHDTFALGKIRAWLEHPVSSV